MYTYLLLNGLTLFFPVALSFDAKVYYFGKWKAAFLGLLPAAIFFIIWDIWFTEAGIWHFNPDYVVGLSFLKLPLEEWLFFVTVPFANLFIYEVLICYLGPDWFRKAGQFFLPIAAFVLLIIGFFNINNLYTGFTFGVTAGWLLLNYFWLKPFYIGMFWMAYLVHLIPFGVVNGILTAWPVVIYNNAENLSLRVGTIPIEDSIYSLLLFLMCVNAYEYLKGRL